MTHWYGGGKVYMHADHHTAAWSSNGQILLIGTDGGFAILRDPFRAVVPSQQERRVFPPTLLLSTIVGILVSLLISSIT